MAQFGMFRLLNARELFPNEIESAKAERKYYRMFVLESLEKLAANQFKLASDRVVLFPSQTNLAQKLISKCERD